MTQNAKNNFAEALVLLTEWCEEYEARILEARAKVIRIDEWQKGERKVVPVDTDE